MRKECSLKTLFKIKKKNKKNRILQANFAPQGLQMVKLNLSAVEDENFQTYFNTDFLILKLFQFLFMQTVTKA